jgi:hypothetical protein
VREERRARLSARMICCTRMENSPSPSDATPAQRHVRLRRAVIRTDGARLYRTAEFTDGSMRSVEMDWPEVRRVAALRRDVLTDPVLCVAISDPSNVVVLDESMEGWQGLIEALPQRLAAELSFTDWRSRIARDDGDSHWTALFEKDIAGK